MSKITETQEVVFKNNINYGIPNFANYQSYGRWVHGNLAFGPGLNEFKFDTIAAEYDPTDYVLLELVGGSVNGKAITPGSVEVHSEDITIRDDGFGAYATNYVDFIRNIFSSNGLVSTLSGTSLYEMRMTWNKNESFHLIFLESGYVTRGATTHEILPNKYFGIKACDGYYIADSLNAENFQSFYGLSQCQIWTPY